MIKDFCIISFASGEPYLYESEILGNLCDTYNINFKLYDFDWLMSQKIYVKNKKLFNSKKSGYCAWKPYIILDALEYYQKVLYLDSSMLFDINVLENYINSSNYILSPDTELKNIEYCREETFEIMDCNYYNENQVWAGAILAYRNAIKFLQEWGKYCLIEKCISDKNILSSPLLKYHLYDQSIYSLLYAKYKLTRIKNICYNDDGSYATYFYDSRERGHRKYIVEKFGNEIMEYQDKLIYRFANQYLTNGSCAYNPLPYLDYVQ